MRNPGLDEVQAGIKIARRNINDLRWYHPYHRNWKGIKQRLNESETKVWKSWLKTQHSKHKGHGTWSHHFMANRLEKMDNGNSEDFIFFGSKITADGDYSHEIKRRLLLGRKAMTNLDSILKDRDITLLTKVCPVKTMVFPVVMYGCEIWNIKKAECRRIDAFELWCWKRFLRVPGIARRSEDLMLKLKLLYFGHLMLRTGLIGNDPDDGKDWGQKEKGTTEDEMVGWHHQFNGHEVEQAPGVGDGQGNLECCSPWVCKESDTTECLNWNELIYKVKQNKSSMISNSGSWDPPLQSGKK